VTLKYLYTTLKPSDEESKNLVEEKVKKAKVADDVQDKAKGKVFFGLSYFIYYLCSFKYLMFCCLPISMKNSKLCQTWMMQP
jgi:hypothetical protein